MSKVLETAAAALGARTEGADIDFSAKFDIDGEGCLMLDAQGVRIADEDADVTISADRDTFEALFNGDLNPTSAFMSGRLKIDGALPLAMRLGTVLS